MMASGLACRGVRASSRRVASAALLPIEEPEDDLPPQQSGAAAAQVGPGRRRRRALSRNGAVDRGVAPILRRERSRSGAATRPPLRSGVHRNVVFRLAAGVAPAAVGRSRSPTSCALWFHRRADRIDYVDRHRPGPGHRRDEWTACKWPPKPCTGAGPGWRVPVGRKQPAAGSRIGEHKLRGWAKRVVWLPCPGGAR